MKKTVSTILVMIMIFNISISAFCGVENSIESSNSLYDECDKITLPKISDPTIIVIENYNYPSSERTSFKEEGDEGWQLRLVWGLAVGFFIYSLGQKQIANAEYEYRH